MSQLYVAYGSNINLEQMHHRCPDATVYDTGTLKNTALQFSKVATIEAKKGAETPVVVYNLPEHDERTLDVYEGYPHKYIKKNVSVELSDGRQITAMAYVMKDGKTLETPSDAYYSRISDGYLSFGFDNVFLEEAYNRAAAYEYNNRQFSLFSPAYKEKYYPNKKTNNQKLQESLLSQAVTVGQYLSEYGLAEQLTAYEKGQIAKSIINSYNGKGEFSRHCEEMCEAYAYDDYSYDTFPQYNYSHASEAARMYPTASDNKQLYIAYGSNMNIAQMSRRCPNSELIGTAELKGYELCFSNYATIKPNEKQNTSVAIWSIDSRDWDKLDQYEGYPSLYRKERLNVQVGGKEQSAIVYVMNGKCPDLMPSQTYIDIVKQGYIDNNLPIEKLDTALEKCKKGDVMYGRNNSRTAGAQSNINAVRVPGQRRH